MDESGRNRIRLWLRGERAFGLTVVGQEPVGTEAAVASTSPQARESAPAAAAARPPAPLVASLPLFDESGPAPTAPSPTDQSTTAGPPLSTDERRRLLAAMDRDEVSGCAKCRLCETRTNTVFGEGDPDARIFFIGEGPGETEDLQGRPFVGRAGELLNKQIAAMGLRREQVFIANIVKCRPPGNRVPAPDEVATCTPYLQRQLETVQPRVIVTLGLPAAKYMLGSTSTMGRLRGQWHAWRGIKLMPTYHPAFLLRAPTYENRSAVWSDLQKVMVEVGVPMRKGPDAGQG